MANVKEDMKVAVKAVVVENDVRYALRLTKRLRGGVWRLAVHGPLCVGEKRARGFALFRATRKKSSVFRGGFVCRGTWN